MSNHPNRAPHHGHLPGHLRDTFRQAIEAFIACEPGAPLPLVPYEIRYRERLISIAEACRLVWHCTDILPGVVLADLQDCLSVAPASQTYAAAAHALLRELQAAGRVDTEADIARRRLYDARDVAWRDLEGWTFAESANDSSLDGDKHFLRFRARAAADMVVAQWRERPQRVPTTSLEQLAERVAAAEDAIDAAAVPLKAICPATRARVEASRRKRRDAQLVEV
jgi:hypothetical protein